MKRGGGQSNARGGAGGTPQRSGSVPVDLMRNRDMWRAPRTQRTHEQVVAAAAARQIQTSGTTALYQPLALPRSSSSSAEAAPVSVEQRVLDAMVAGQPRTDVARLAAVIDDTVRDKSVVLFVRRRPTPAGAAAAAYARHSTRPRRLAERTGRTVRRAAPQVAVAADALAAMAADGRQLPGLALTVRASRRLPHLVGREFTVLGAYRARRSVLLYDRARAQTVRCAVDDIQACHVPRLSAVVPLRKLVQSVLS